MFFHQGREVGSLHPYALGCQSDIPFAFVERSYQKQFFALSVRLLQDAFFYSHQFLSGSRYSPSNGSAFQIQIVHQVRHIQDPAICHNDQMLDSILKLANISGPFIIDQGLHRVFGNPSIVFPVLVQKCFRK